MSASGPIAGRVAVRALFAPSACRRLSSFRPRTTPIAPSATMPTGGSVNPIGGGSLNPPTVAVVGAPSSAKRPSTARPALSRSDARISEGIRSMTLRQRGRLDVRWHQTDPIGQCHNGRPVYATVCSVGRVGPEPLHDRRAAGRPSAPLRSTATAALTAMNASQADGRSAGEGEAERRPPEIAIEHAQPRPQQSPSGADKRQLASLGSRFSNCIRRGEPRFSTLQEVAS